MVTYTKVLFVLSLCFFRSESLRCFSCVYSSASGRYCEGTTESLTSNYLIECLPNQNYCDTLTTYGSGNTVSSILRGCTSEGTTSLCTANQLIAGTSCRQTCNTDGCNGGTATDVNNLPSISTTNDLQCYSCNYNSGYGDSSCQGPEISNNFLVTCSLGESYCSSISSSPTVNGVTIDVKIRSCTARGLGTTENQCVSIAGVQVCARTCQEDGCNGSGIVKGKLLVSFAATMISIFVVKFL